ncbi:MAG: type III-B CRISPR module RAMP protein Cmr4 [Sphingobacteriales bacterium]|nr:type III-B CRISPR module RAMP protein Cmr4 [Sphingobacteriales bacterium]
MFQQTKTLFLVCETPLHAGSGDSLGVVDLPIQRERHTQFPKIEASSLKGALREAFESKLKSRKDDQIIRAFGPDEDGADHAGAMAFSDARLLLFPVKSMKGVFAWVTCPKVLKQLQRDLTIANSLPSDPDLSKIEKNTCCKSADITYVIANKDKIVLEEYTFTVKKDNETSKLAIWLSEKLFTHTGIEPFWKDHLSKNLVVLSDDDFTDFVTLSTEVITRIKINNDTGTVQTGALFNEEYLPAESVLYSLVMAANEFIDKDKLKEREKQGGARIGATKIMSFFETTIEQISYLQIGGNATLGKGIVHAVIS